ncbi:MAG TPA: ATP-binding protein [Polyangiaceae bacterium]|nr:ATP-binding protein [Polyangiaceae bacterium]
MHADIPNDLQLVSTIADHLPVGIFVATAPGGGVVYANHAFREILGVAPDPSAYAGAYSRPYGIHTRDGALYPEDRLPFARALREGGDVTVDDIVIHRPDGRRVNIRAFARPLRDAAGDIAHVAIAFTDITQEVQARSRAAAVEERLRHLLDHVPLILFAIDRHGIVTLSEGRGLQGLGVRPKELVGRSVHELYANDPLVLSMTRRVLAGEALHVTADMGSAVLETSYTPLRNAAGEIDGAIGVCVDVTERARMHARLVQAERLASMGTLSAAVAHEINNPLTYVIGNLELLARRLAGAPARLDPELASYVSEAREGAEVVRRIVRGLQVFARRDDSPPEPTDVQAAVERAIVMADNVIKHRARLVRRFERTPPVLASALRLGQVFVNLLLNAAQAIPEGRADDNEIRVATSHDSATNLVAVTIEDTGSGMSPEVQSRIFEPFFTTKPIGTGTGLGLSICYGIVESLGGRLEVESSEGRGSTFRVLLPAAAATASAAATAPAVAAELPPAPGATPARRGRLLVIDDDEKVARSLALVLLDRHDVEVSVEPRAIVERIAAGERFDVIFCDLMMPEMTGVDFHAATAALSSEQAARIVFVTGGAFTAATREFVDRVSNTVLEKPFDVRALDVALERLLSAGGAASGRPSR